MSKSSARPTIARCPAKASRTRSNWMLCVSEADLITISKLLLYCRKISDGKAYWYIFKLGIQSFNI